jgi:hypothetical protein
LSQKLCGATLPKDPDEEFKCPLNDHVCVQSGVHEVHMCAHCARTWQSIIKISIQVDLPVGYNEAVVRELKESVGRFALNNVRSAMQNTFPRKTSPILTVRRTD